MNKTQLTDKHVKDLANLSMQFRKQILEMISCAKSGHPGGSLSAIDIIATLFLHVMKASSPAYATLTQDVFILSKGHGVPALYVVLKHVGLLPKGLDLNTLRQLGSPLQGHPDRVQIPEVIASTGSLGQGLSIAVGIALAKKLNKDPHRVFVLTGDGELQAGQIWEAAMSAAKFKLDNLTVFVDRNHGQIDGTTEEVMNIEPLSQKWAACNWQLLNIDGHDFRDIFNAACSTPKDQPLCIIAETIKGRGVSFMEHNHKWHGIAPTTEELKKSHEELDSAAREIDL